LYLATDGFGFLKIAIDQNTNENDYTQKNITWLSNGQGFLVAIHFVLNKINFTIYGLEH